MQKLKLGMGLFVFLGLVCAQASAQGIPDEARKMIAQNLQGSFIVFREEVQEELNLTDEQKDKLDEYLREQLPDAVEFFQKLQTMEGAEREKEHKAYRQKMQEKLTPVLQETLKDDQNKRLRQLGLQQEGAFALWHGDVKIAKELKVTDEQRKQFMAVVKEFQKNVGPLIKEAQSGGNHDEIRAKIMKIRKVQEGKIEALLTDTQKLQWKDMLGKPLALDD